MKRDIYKTLNGWRNSIVRKPLLVKGARQTGKTWLLKEFGRLEFKQMVYCNFEEEPLLEDLFRNSLKPSDIIPKLSIHAHTDISPGETLLILDEIQLSNNALNSLKYFCEEMPELHVAAAGSLLGLKLSKPRSFPVGKVTLLDVFPMTFLEFLDAVGEARLRAMLESLPSLDSIPELFHAKLTDLLKVYYVVGGMPEALDTYTREHSLERVRTVQRNILNTYALDFAKHAPKVDVPRLGIIWDSIPAYLAKENKKFIFSGLAKGARAREYEAAIQWLDDASLIHRSYAVESVQLPIAGFADRSAFKVFSLDVGLLAAQAHIPVDAVIRRDDLFSTYRGAFVENYVAQQLTALMGSEGGELYYWRSESRKAEIDFLVTLHGQILPLEAKAGENPRSKSLGVYRERFNPKLSLRTTLLNLKRQDSLVNIPLYAIGVMPRVAELTGLI
jgi:predicted AAA+ superfamily ATPase